MTLALLFAATHHWSAGNRLLIDGPSTPVRYLNAAADDAGWIPAADAFSPSSQLWPPGQFESHNAALVLFVGRDGIAKLCGAPAAGIVRLGCQYVTKDGLPVIALANPCLFPKTELFAGIACHELAHVNGWRHQ